MADNYIIEFKNLSKIVKEKKIINNISIKLPKNKFIAIMGPSGSGKTTFLNIASGLEQATSGQLFINSTDILKLKESKLTKFRATNIGYIFQNYNLIDYLNVKENITISQKIINKKIDQTRLKELIEITGLKGKEKAKINSLSGGQKQRVAIARALIGSNEIIFADEPTGALDINTRENIISLLKETQQQYNKTLVVVSHDPVVASHADLIIFIVDGVISEVLENKTSSEIIAKKLLEIEKHGHNSN